MDLRRAFSQLRSAAMILTATTLLGSCHGANDFDSFASEKCRFEPERCDAGAGALCDDNRDCADPLFCCEDDDNCGGSMCTADHNDDFDCPSGMRGASTTCVSTPATETVTARPR